MEKLIRLQAKIRLWLKKTFDMAPGEVIPTNKEDVELDRYCQICSRLFGTMSDYWNHIEDDEHQENMHLICR